MRIDELLDAYDTELRTDAETPSAVDVMPLGPLRLVTFPGGRGFVTYPRLDDIDAATLSTWVDAALRHFTGNPDISDVEWKTRGHDRLPHLDAVLRDHGFVAGEPESIMIGEAASLIADIALPTGSPCAPSPRTPTCAPRARWRTPCSATRSRHGGPTR